jgi:hypothetical protein
MQRKEVLQFLEYWYSEPNTFACDPWYWLERTKRADVPSGSY